MKARPVSGRAFPIVSCVCAEAGAGTSTVQILNAYGVTMVPIMSWHCHIDTRVSTVGSHGLRVEVQQPAGGRMNLNPGNLQLV